MNKKKLTFYLFIFWVYKMCDVVCCAVLCSVFIFFLLAVVFVILQKFIFGIFFSDSKCLQPKRGRERESFFSLCGYTQARALFLSVRFTTGSCYYYYCYTTYVYSYFITSSSSSSFLLSGFSVYLFANFILEF